ncbi:hypothetical protein AXK61_14490 [Tsukamurella pseudospumae]|uniref:Uncharacterized protein n=1 Tax=Tsukamurella pseudospumae TaxID=239498 RepID=A0A137ZRC4_9ACTN|nr:hypothetical protein AXK61_14490 [Tsukamurella pseudospumae]
MSWVEVKLTEARRQIHKDVYAVVEKYVDEGWRIRAMGHKFVLYCPCSDGGDHARVRVFGTPKNPSTHARSIDRECRKCPGVPR